MTTVPNQAHPYGIPPLAITRIRGAQKANKIAIVMSCIALAAFVIFGTIASIKMFHDNQLLYRLYYNVPFILIALTIPITLYNAFIVYRYRLSQTSMVIMTVGVSSIILLGGMIFADTVWLGLSCWLGVAFLFQVSFKRFFDFLEAENETENVEQVLANANDDSKENH
jgi:hypothetical protein